MNIELKRTSNGKGWIADCRDFPGSPVIGDGTTREMAVACLMYRVLARKAEYDVVPNEILTINDKLWKSPFPKYDNTR